MKDNFIIDEDSNLQSLLNKNKFEYRNSLDTIQTIFKMCTNYFEKQSTFSKNMDFFSKLENTICLDGELFSGKTTFINDLIKYADNVKDVKVIKIDLYDYSLSSEPLHKLSTDLIYQIKNTKLEYSDFKKKENNLLDIISALKNFLLEDSIYDPSAQFNTVFGDRMILTEQIKNILDTIDTYINKDKVLVFIDNLENITNRNDYYFFSFFMNFLFKIKKIFFIAALNKKVIDLNDDKFIKYLQLNNSFYKTINMKLITSFDDKLNDYINLAENIYIKILSNELKLSIGIISMCINNLKNFKLLNKFKLKNLDENENILLNGLIFYMFYVKIYDDNEYELIIKNINYIKDSNEFVTKTLSFIQLSNLNLPLWIYKTFLFNPSISHLHEENDLSSYQENIKNILKNQNDLSANKQKNNLIFFRSFNCLCKCYNFSFENFNEKNTKEILFLLSQTIYN